MQRLDLLWLLVKRRLARQRLVRSDTTDESGPPCEHVWTMVCQQTTGNGSVEVSTCSLCAAVLREWLEDSGSEGSAT